MRTMANLDYTFMVRELQPLAGKFYDKFYELGEGKFRLKFGRDNIIIELGTRLHRTKYLEQAPEATSFAMKVRKELKGKLLTKLSQHKKDRVIIFDFDGTKLIAEMFATGNLLLVRDGKILAVYSRKHWKSRSLTAKSEYKPPPSETKTLEEIFKLKSEAPIGSALRALDVGMSYVRAILKDAGIPDSKPLNELTTDEQEAIESAFRKLMGSLAPRVLYAGEKPESYSLSGKGKKFPTLSEALDEYYGIPEAADEQEEEDDKELDKLKYLLETQEKRLKELAEEEEDAKEKAEFVYAHYEEIEKILELYDRSGMDPLEKLAKQKGWKLNKKEKILEI